MDEKELREMLFWWDIIYRLERMIEKIDRAMLGGDKVRGKTDERT